MGLNADFINVKVQVNGKTQTIKMERGTSFENKGGIFTAGETNGTLKMTNYQLKTFEAMANNYKENDENGIVLSRKDIELAEQMYKKGGFVNDISEFLPNNYKIEKPVLKSNENLLQVYVTNGKPSQSATLKFSFTNLIKKEQNKNTQTTPEITSKQKEEIKKIIDEYYIEGTNDTKITSVTTDKNGNTKYVFSGTIIDAGEGENPNVSDYIILDKTGNIIERKETQIQGGEYGCYSSSYTITKGDKVSYYSPGGELKGILEEQADGRIKHMDANGNCLYYTNYKEIKNNAKGIDEGHTYYYDPNGSLKYIVKLNYNDRSYENGFVQQIEVYKNGEVVKKGSGWNNSIGCHEPDYVIFKELSDECIGGVYQITETSY